MLNGAHGVDPSLASPRSGYNGAQLPSTELTLAIGSLFEVRRLIFDLCRWVSVCSLVAAGVPSDWLSDARDGARAREGEQRSVECSAV